MTEYESTPQRLWREAGKDIVTRLEACFDSEHYSPEVSDIFVSAKLIRDACTEIESAAEQLHRQRAEPLADLLAAYNERDEALAEVARLREGLREAREVCRNWNDSFGCASESDLDMYPWLEEE